MRNVGPREPSSIAVLCSESRAGFEDTLSVCNQSTCATVGVVDLPCDTNSIYM